MINEFSDISANVLEYFSSSALGTSEAISDSVKSLFLITFISLNNSILFGNGKVDTSNKKLGFLKRQQGPWPPQKK